MEIHFRLYRDGALVQLYDCYDQRWYLLVRGANPRAPAMASAHDVSLRGGWLSGCWYTGLTSAFAAAYMPFITCAFDSTNRDPHLRSAISAMAGNDGYSSQRTFLSQPGVSRRQFVVSYGHVVYLTCSGRNYASIA